MANKSLFSTRRASVPQKPHNTRNEAGGKAYKMDDAHALCQFVVTGCFGDSYYSNAKEQLASVKKLVRNIDPVIIAKAAVYGREKGKMKDAPAYLCAVLASRGGEGVELLKRIFPRVINSSKMLCNFVQIVRSGETGRRSFGTAVKRLIQQWFNELKTYKVFNASIGQANPSIADIIKMVHVRPESDHQQAMYAYILGKAHNGELLPESVRQFEAFKRDNSLEVPAQVPYRALTNCELSTAQWRDIGRKMPWNTLRLNLNMLSRKGVFEGAGGHNFSNDVAAKLSDAEAVRACNAFPYQLLTTFQNIKEVPVNVKNALQEAMEIAVENVPSLGDVAVCVDLSSSMNSSITGHRIGATSVTQCSHVAGLMAASVLRNNKNARIVGFGSTAREFEVNGFDSVMTNAAICGTNHGVGHGTDIGSAIACVGATMKAKLIVIVTDCQAWQNGGWYGSSRDAATEWATYKRKVRGAKLAYIDVVHNQTVQELNAPDVLNIGGFSDAVFDILARFAEFGGKGNQFTDVVSETEI